MLGVDKQEIWIYQKQTGFKEVAARMEITKASKNINMSKRSITKFKKEVDKMNPDGICQIIDKLGDKLGIASAELIGYYSEWCFVKAIGFAILGTLCLVGAIIVGKKLIKSEKVGIDIVMLGWIIIFIILVIGMIMLMNNFPNMIFPETAAIRQLIMDIRG